MSAWLFQRVGVDVHVGDHYFIVGRVPVIVLGFIALSVIGAGLWLVLRAATWVRRKLWATTTH